MCLSSNGRTSVRRTRIVPSADLRGAAARRGWCGARTCSANSRPRRIFVPGIQLVEHLHRPHVADRASHHRGSGPAALPRPMAGRDRRRWPQRASCRFPRTTMSTNWPRKCGQRVSQPPRTPASRRPASLMIALRMSLIAVCCSSNSVRSSVRWRNSLSSRVFSIAMTAWAAKFLTRLDLLVGERPHLLAVDGDGADHVSSLSIGTTNRVRAPARSASATNGGSRSM